VPSEEQVKAYLKNRQQPALGSAPGDQSVYVCSGDVVLDHFPPYVEWDLEPVYDERNPSRPVMGHRIVVFDRRSGHKKIVKTYDPGRLTISRGL
jgi:hypothetical protein